MKNHFAIATVLTASTLLAACSPNTSNQPTATPGAESIAVPATQMAIVQVGNGGPEVLKYQSIPVLEPSAGEVLIQVVAAGVNPIDWRNREGGGRPPGSGSPPGGAGGPSVPGGDLAGIVVRLGEGVTNVALGDAVFAKLALGRGRLNGAYAHYAIAPASQVVAKPTDHTYAEAAGLGTVRITALRTIEHVNVSEGQRVFINGIAGGIGSSAAQLAKARGAYVLGTASGRHHEYLKSIGVDEAINYREVQFDEVIEQPVDVVIETVGTETANQALNILKPGGQLVSIAGPADADACVAARVTCSRLGGEVGRSNEDLLAEIGRLAEAGDYRLNVDATFPLTQAAVAQDQNHNVGTQGKVILVVDPELANQK